MSRTAGAERGVLAVFADPGGAVRAVRALREAGHADVRAVMPAAFPEVVAALGRGRSRVGPVTMTGAVIGTVLGFALCIATSLSWPLVTGGKPIVSLPPFVVIAFEISVLIGALVNLVALVVAAGRGGHRRRVPYDVRFLGDRIGLFVAGGDEQSAESILRASGAEEVRRVV